MLAAWIWSPGPGPRPGALLVHGWEGRGSQLGAFVEPLLERGFRVVAFDAPGHGRSPGARSSLVEMADAVVDAQRALGPFDAVVAHSAGAAASTVAMTRGFAPKRAVFVAPPVDLGEFLGSVARKLGLSPQTAALTRHRIERRFGVRWESLRAIDLAPSMTTPLLVLHDTEDREVAVQGAIELTRAWPASRLVLTRGLGHRRILRDSDVLRRAAAFAAAEPS